MASSSRIILSDLNRNLRAYRHAVKVNEPVQPALTTIPEIARLERMDELHGLVLTGHRVAEYAGLLLCYDAYAPDLFPAPRQRFISAGGWPARGLSFVVQEVDYADIFLHAYKERLQVNLRIGMFDHPSESYREPWAHLFPRV